MTDPDWLRKNLAALTDDDLRQRTLLVLRADAFEGRDSRAADACCFAWRGRNREEEYLSLVELVKREIREHRRFNKETTYECSNIFGDHSAGEPGNRFSGSNLQPRTSGSSEAQHRQGGQ